MAVEIGARVGAICRADEATVHLYGYGTYQGRFVPLDSAKGLNIGLPNPRILLDDGKVVYGCECWWGPEEEIKAAISGRMIVLVDIDQDRLGAASK